MTSFALKIIACVCMFIDHSGYAIFGKFSYFNYIGRLAFPIFAFQITEGYTHTKNLKKYIVRLLIFAIISQIPFALFLSKLTNEYSFNIFFTLLLGLFSIIGYDKLSNFILKFVPVVIFATIGQIANVDYGAYGVILIFVFYLFRNNKLTTAFGFLFAVFINHGRNILVNYLEHGFNPNYIDKQIAIGVCVLASLFPILLYNKKQGKKLKYFLYIFYPAHLLLLYYLM